MGATGRYNLMYLDTPASNGVGQDLITAAPIPLPAAAWLLGGALASLGALRARRSA
jgi:hypothetical protein